MSTRSISEVHVTPSFRPTAPRFASFAIIAALVSAGCGDADGHPPDGNQDPDASASPDAGADAGTPTDAGMTSDGGTIPGDDAGTIVDDAGTIFDDAGTTPDASDTGPAIIATAIGTLDEASGAVVAVPYGTFASALAGGLVVTPDAVAEIRGAGDVVLDAPATTPVEPGMSIHVVDSGGAARVYAIEMEVLFNTTVLLVDGELVRFSTHYYTDGPGEFFIIDDVGTGTHYFFTPNVTTGTYGPLDGEDAVAGRGIEVLTAGGIVVRAGGNTWFEPPFEMSLVVTSDELTGRLEGALDSYDDGELRDVVGWFHSDRVSRGGW